MNISLGEKPGGKPQGNFNGSLNTVEITFKTAALTPFLFFLTALMRCERLLG
jgi:hypothetical protein